MFKFLFCCTSEAAVTQVLPYQQRVDDDSFQFSLLSSYRDKPKGLMIPTNRIAGADTSVFFSNFAARNFNSVGVSANVMDDVVAFVSNLSFEGAADINSLSVKDMDQLVKYSYEAVRPKNPVALYLLQMAIGSQSRNADPRDDLTFTLTALGVATTFIERMRDLEENIMQQPDALWLPVTENGYMQLSETRSALSLKSCLALTDIVLMATMNTLTCPTFFAFPEDSLEKIALAVDCLFLRSQSLGPLLETNASQTTKLLLCQTMWRACRVLGAVLKLTMTPQGELSNKITLRLVSLLQSLAPNLSICRHNCGDFSRDVLTAFWFVADCIVDRVLCSTTVIVPPKTEKTERKSNNWFSSSNENSHSVYLQQQQQAQQAQSLSVTNVSMNQIKMACVSRIRQSVVTTLPGSQEIFLEISRLKNSNHRQTAVSYQLTGDADVDYFSMSLLKLKHAFIGMQYLLRIGSVDTRDLRINAPSIKDWYTSLGESLLLVLSIPFRGPGKGLGGMDDYLVVLAPFLAELLFHVTVGSDVGVTYDWIYWELTKRLSNYTDVAKRKLRRAKHNVMNALSNSQNFTSLFDNDNPGAETGAEMMMTGGRRGQTQRSNQPSSRFGRLMSGDSGGDSDWLAATTKNQRPHSIAVVPTERKRSPSMVSDLLKPSSGVVSGGDTGRRSSHGSHGSNRSTRSTRKNSISGPVGAAFGRNLSGGVNNKPATVARNNSGTAPSNYTGSAAFGRTNSNGFGRNNSGGNGFGRNNSGGNNGFGRTNSGSNGAAVALVHRNSGSAAMNPKSPTTVAVTTTIVRNNSGGVSAVISPKLTVPAIADSPFCAAANPQSPLLMEPVAEVSARHDGDDCDTSRSVVDAAKKKDAQSKPNLFSWIKSAASPLIPSVSTPKCEEKEGGTAPPAPSTAPPVAENAFSLKLMSKLLVHAAPKFVVGDKVEVRFPSKIGGERWVTGKIVCVNNDSTYNITFTDGKTHNNKPEDQLRRSEGSDRHSDRRSERERTKRVPRISSARKSHTVRVQAVAIPVEILKYKQGDVVDGLVQLRNRTKRWFPGTITQVNIDGTYRIDYLDGDVEEEKMASELRMTKRRAYARLTQSQSLSSEGTSHRSVGEHALSSRLPPQFVVNDTVDGLHTLQNGSRRWFLARIIQVNKDGTYNVRYCDGDTQDNKPENELRVSKRRGSSELDSSTGSFEIATKRSDAANTNRSELSGWVSPDINPSSGRSNNLSLSRTPGTSMDASIQPASVPSTSLGINWPTRTAPPVPSSSSKEETRSVPAGAAAPVVESVPSRPSPAGAEVSNGESATIVVGSIVDGCCTLSNGSKRWFPGKITKVYDDGLHYDMMFNDGEVQLNKPAEEVRLPRSRVPRPLPTPVQEQTALSAPSEAFDVVSLAEPLPQPLFTLKVPTMDESGEVRIEKSEHKAELVSIASDDSYESDESGEHMFAIPSAFDNNVFRKEKEGVVPVMRIGEIEAGHGGASDEYLYEDDDEYMDEDEMSGSDGHSDGYGDQDEAINGNESSQEGRVGGEASDLESSQVFSLENEVVTPGGAAASAGVTGDVQNVSSRSSTGFHQQTNRSWYDNSSLDSGNGTRRSSVPRKSSSGDNDIDGISTKKQIINLSDAPVDIASRTQLGQLPLHLLHEPVEVMPELMVRTYTLICAILLRRCIVDKYFLDPACCQPRALTNPTQVQYGQSAKAYERATSRASSRASSRQSSARSSKSADSDRGPAPTRHINLLYNVREFLTLIPDQFCFPVIFEMACLLGPAYVRLLKLLSENYFDSCLPSHIDQSEKIGEGGFGNIIQVTCPAECSKMEAKKPYCRTSQGVHQLQRSKIARWERCNCAEGTHKSVNSTYCSPVRMDLGHEERRPTLKPNTYAVKRIPREKNVHDEPALKGIYNEVSTLEALRGITGVCQMLDYGVNAQEFWIVMELGGPNLSEWRRRNIDEHESGGFTQIRKFLSTVGAFRGQEKESAEHSYHFSKEVLSVEDCAKCLAIFVDACYILKSVHDADIAHFDVKCNNFVLRYLRPVDSDKVNIREEIPSKAPTATQVDPAINFEQMREAHLNCRASGSIILIDFGEAVNHMSSSRAAHVLTSACRGTLAIQSPEILSISPSANNTVVFPPPSKSSDVWALGCLLVELITGDYLFAERQWTELYVTLCTKKFSSSSIPIASLKSSLGLLPANVQGEITELVLSILVQKPAMRPQISEIILVTNRILAMDVFKQCYSVPTVRATALSPIHGEILEDWMSRDRMDEIIACSTIRELSEAMVDLYDRVVVVDDAVSLRIENAPFRPVVLSSAATSQAQLSNYNLLKTTISTPNDLSLFEPRGTARDPLLGHSVDAMNNRFDDVDSLISWADLKRTVHDLGNRLLDNWTLQSGLIQVVIVNSESEMANILKTIHGGQLEKQIYTLDLTLRHQPEMLQNILYLFDLLTDRMSTGDKVTVCVNSNREKTSFSFDDALTVGSNSTYRAKQHSKLCVSVAFALSEALSAAYSKMSCRMKSDKQFCCSAFGIGGVAPDLDHIVCKRIVEVVLDYLSCHSQCARSKRNSDKSLEMNQSARFSSADHTEA